MFEKLHPAAEPMKIGDKIGPYRMDALLGRGGMAEVFKVHHDGLHRFEALKTLPPQMTFDKTFVERFLNEARTAANLQHPHIAAIYSVSAADAPQPYFTMELIESGDLADFIAEHPRLSLEEAAPILTQIALALDYAHGQGVIHRDIKPGNIMLKVSGRGGFDTKVVDFGIAKAAEEASGTRLTRTGMIIGTPEYMSPEQGGSGAKVGAATDQYALGVIAYEMLCGVPPFKAQSDTSPITIIMNHVRDEPRAPIVHNPQLSKAANNAILKALAKQPEDRFDSCGEFADALTGSKVVALPVWNEKKPMRQSVATPRRAPSGVLLAGLLIVALAGGAWFFGPGQTISKSGYETFPATSEPEPQSTPVEDVKNEPNTQTETSDGRENIIGKWSGEWGGIDAAINFSSLDANQLGGVLTTFLPRGRQNRVRITGYLSNDGRNITIVESEILEEWKSGDWGYRGKSQGAFSADWRRLSGGGMTPIRNKLQVGL